MGELDTFRRSRRPGGVDESKEIIGPDACDPFLGAMIALKPEFLPPNLEIAERMDMLWQVSPFKPRTRARRRSISMTHQNEVAKFGELFPDRLHLGKNGSILDKGHLNISMIYDIGNLTTGHIGSTGDVGSSTELNSGISQNPLKAIIREDRNVAAGLDP